MAAEAADISLNLNNKNLNDPLSHAWKAFKHSCHDADFVSDADSELNSYRFPKPRKYQPNLYVSKELEVTDLLVDISTNVGPKVRPSSYNAFLENALKAAQKPKKAKAVVLNNIENETSTLKSVELVIENSKISALMDTGSTHNLIAYDFFCNLKNKTFKPVQMDMKVAGATLTNNIVGKAQLNTTFPTTTGTVTIPLTFLVAHKINGYQSILGADMLTNPRVIKATTPYHIHLNESYGNAVVPLHAITCPPAFNSNSLEEKEQDQNQDTIDEEIIKEHILIDPTKLSEKFSHLDCEINPNLDQDTR
jgi:hypothetical protein